MNFVFSHNSCKFEGRAKIIINRECLVHTYLYDNQGDESCASRFSNMVLSKKHRNGKTTCEICTFVQHHLPFRYSKPAASNQPSQTSDAINFPYLLLIKIYFKFIRSSFRNRMNAFLLADNSFFLFINYVCAGIFIIHAIRATATKFIFRVLFNTSDLYLSAWCRLIG